MKQKSKKKFITLIEIMIVMFLIALIAGVVAYNYRGSLDEGRAFSTQQNIEKIRNILELETAKQHIPLTKTALESDWKTKILGNSPLVKDVNTLTKDGWGNDLVLTADDKGNLTITSPEYEKYKKNHPEYRPEEKKSSWW